MLHRLSRLGNLVGRQQLNARRIPTACRKGPNTHRGALGRQDPRDLEAQEELGVLDLQRAAHAAQPRLRRQVRVQLVLEERQVGACERRGRREGREGEVERRESGLGEVDGGEGHASRGDLGGSLALLGWGGVGLEERCTSGTPEMVVAEASQVTALWMLSTEVCVSAGRVSEPITKQAVARRAGAGAERADARSARWVRRVRERILQVVD
jgi:hypothetical protein